MKDMGFRSRLWLAVVSCALLGVAAGVALTLARVGAGGPVADPGPSTDNPLIGEPGSALEIADRGSSEIQFPPGLSGLEVSPTDIVVDASGDVWVVGISPGGELSLYHGGQDGSKSASYVIKADSPGWPRLEIDEGRRLLIAAGDQVIRVQPNTLEYETFTVPVSAAPDADAEARTAMEMRLEGGSVFLSGRSMNSITRLTLSSGKMEEIQIPPPSAATTISWSPAKRYGSRRRATHRADRRPILEFWKGAPGGWLPSP